MSKLTATIQGFGRRRLWQQALAVVREIGPEEKLNLRHYGALLAACEKASQWQLALEVFQELQLVAGPPDLAARGAALGACARAGRWREALHLLGSEDVDALACAGVIRACARGTRWQHALVLFDEMGRDGSHFA
ncbi:unnamed protein product, partial [Polarella glacialis]